MVVGIIQAHLGSTRLPNKMLLSLRGYPVIQWVVERVKKAAMVQRLAAAIPDGRGDDPLEMVIDQLGCEVIRGDEHDVLSRFFVAASRFTPDHVIRICADNPLISPEAIDILVEEHLMAKADYTYNHVPRDNSWPDGLGAEIVTFKTLRLIHQRARGAEEREHIFNYIWNNKDKFRIHTFEPPKEEWMRPDIKLDIDTWDDYLRLFQMGIGLEASIDEIIMRARQYHG